MTDLLIHVGFPKASSTWLQESLFKRQDFGFFSLYPEKEDRERLNEELIYTSALMFDSERFRANVSELCKSKPVPSLVPVISAESLVGTRLDATRSLARCVTDNLRSAFPNAKILLVIREQVSMILSNIFPIYARGRNAVT